MSRSEAWSRSRRMSFVIVMCALSSALALFTIPIGFTSLHVTQFPIILTGLIAGPWTGSMVGLLGTIVMAYRLTPPNPYIVFGNAMLGFFTGLLYSNLKKIKTRPIVPQVLSTLGAYAIQSPYVYLTDVYLAGIPSQVVLTILLPSLLVEDIICVLFSHLVIYRMKLDG
ncbi:ECF transporter S component [Candidatus Bathyarchaeota archaeon]|nr:ECF transporter S component [Candidatus Bathyarchaeota archaeon]